MQETPAGAFIRLVRRAPAALQLGFTQGFFLPAGEAFSVFLVGRLACEIKRPTADQRLIQPQFVASANTRAFPFEGQREVSPAFDLFGIPARVLAQDGQSRTGVLPTF